MHQEKDEIAIIKPPESQTLEDGIVATIIRFQRSTPLPHYAEVHARMKTETPDYDPDQIPVTVFEFSPDTHIFIHHGLTFQAEMEWVRREDPDLWGQMIDHGGMAASRNETRFSPIRRLHQLRGPSGEPLFPGPHNNFGIADFMGKLSPSERVLLIAQVNGLRFNDGSGMYFPNPNMPNIMTLIDEPNMAIYERNLATNNYLVHPTTFIGFDGIMHKALRIHPEPGMDYQEYHDYMKEILAKSGFIYAIRSEPGLIVPSDPTGSSATVSSSIGPSDSRVLTPEEYFQCPQNDTRHSFFHPYHMGAPLFLRETAAMRRHGYGLALMRSMSGIPSDRVRFPLSEIEEYSWIRRDFRILQDFLDSTGYQNRYDISFDKNGDYFIDINLLPGLYNHLCLFVTSSGKIGLVQIGNAYKNISGQTGVTYNEMLIISEYLFNRSKSQNDPYTAMFVGSSGQDPDNITMASGWELWQVYPGLTTNPHQQVRSGSATSPRIALVKGI